MRVEHTNILKNKLKHIGRRPRIELNTCSNYTFSFPNLLNYYTTNFYQHKNKI